MKPASPSSGSSAPSSHVSKTPRTGTLSTGGLVITPTPEPKVPATKPAWPSSGSLPSRVRYYLSSNKGNGYLIELRATSAKHKMRPTWLKDIDDVSRLFRGFTDLDCAVRQLIAFRRDCPELTIRSVIWLQFDGKWRALDG